MWNQNEGASSHGQTASDVQQPPLLDIRDLKVHFPLKGGILGKTVNVVRAVDGIRFQIHAGETVSIVGESGCGKSTTGRAILRLVEPTAGEVYYDGKDLLSLSKAEMRKMRSQMQIIFQDPFASLNPRQTIRQILQEALEIQQVVPREQYAERLNQLIERVGLRPEALDRYPHEFSGGQRQRIGIARALAVEPRFIICDEAVSALDVSIQAQVLNLLQDLQELYQLTYLFIAHDLAVVRHISDRIIVMYLGKIVEIAKKETLFSQPLHPYTKALLSSIPTVEAGERKERIILKGEVPSPLNPPQGCHFHTRCPMATTACKTVVPTLREVGPDHAVSCLLYQEND
ncbi:ABC transporter ATP-binding protein [Rubeoparvulum massiliense]|uniref:ABC transporter ATP-binding protein n=1 Tax=Rubeoparvulum massiliense TaxID=1631346 RepID=UPI00069D467D|nr:dipeptide ABC transporter ATP-binding protein [Rubeoparvulum massiliense]